jgi:hypothetical protein
MLMKIHSNFLFEKGIRKLFLQNISNYFHNPVMLYYICIVYFCVEETVTEYHTPYTQ